jgi:hypothetical protein
MITVLARPENVLLMNRQFYFCYVSGSWQAFHLSVNRIAELVVTVALGSTARDTDGSGYGCVDICVDNLEAATLNPLFLH